MFALPGCECAQKNIDALVEEAKRGGSIKTAFIVSIAGYNFLWWSLMA